MSNVDVAPCGGKSRRVSPFVFGCLVVAALGVGCCGVFGVLAAIAVPNFQEAGVRSKVSRANADLRMMGLALEAYYIDTNSYPVHTETPMDTLLNGTPSMFSDVPVPFPRHVVPGSAMTLTTPVAYLSNYLNDPFRQADAQVGYAYYTSGRGWVVYSPGPDGEYDLLYPPQLFDEEDGALIDGSWAWCSYDPTNGTVSAGDIIRVGP